METKTDLFNVHVWKVFRAIMQRQSELWKRALFIQWSQCRDISLFVCAATQPMEKDDWTLTQKTSNYHFLYRKQKLVFRNLLCFWVSYFFVIFFSFVLFLYRFRHQRLFTWFIWKNKCIQRHSRSIHLIAYFNTFIVFYRWPCVMTNVGNCDC